MGTVPADSVAMWQQVQCGYWYHHLQKFCRNSEENQKEFCRTASKKFCGTPPREPATFFFLQNIYFL
jgi:hypothetical protein